MTLAGQQLGHYRIIHLIKQGGMGEVYLAEDTRISRQVAVKVVREEHQPYLDAEVSQRAERLFQREMKAISQLDHPHILSVYDFGEEPVANSSIIYMVMPYRPEGSLLDWFLLRGSDLLPPQDAGYMIAQGASALQHAHDHNIIHQDVKPSNFLVRANADHPTRPDLFLVDFGIARVMSATSTASNSVRGTYSYMAPEQWSGDAVPASDQYALAIMSYLLLTGQLPFKGRLERMMFQHLTVSPKPPSELNAKLSPAIDAVILRALAKKSDERFSSIKAFAVALQQALDYTDQRVTLAISRGEAWRGGSRTVTLLDERQVTVTIPPNAQHGQVLRLPDQGFSYYDGGPRGSLLLTLSTDEDEAMSVLIDSGEDDLPTVPASGNLAKRPASTADSNKPLPYIDKPIFVSPAVLTPTPSPSGATPLPNNIVSAPLQLGVTLPTSSTRNRNLPSKRHSIVFITVALLLVMVGGVLAVVSVNNTSATSSASATSTAQSITYDRETVAARAINSTATAIVANPDPYRPPSGTLAFVDQLSQPKAWGNFSDTTSGSQCQFVNGAYQISQPQPQPTKPYQCYEGNQYSNFAFEVKMTINQGDCGGLVIRDNSNQSKYYVFEVCQDGSYFFWSAGHTTPLRSHNSSTIKRGQDQLNVIAVVARGSNFDLYINSQKVDSISDSAYSQGSIGLIAHAYNRATKVTYQDARVWTIK